jgi:diguanylate cyclase (GGDEF)-like protein
MAEQKKTKRVVRGIFALLIAAAILRVFYPFYYYTGSKFVSCETLELDEGWNATVHGQDYEGICLSETLFPMCNRGDVLTLTRTLPTDEAIPNPVLQCYSVHAVVDVYLDGELIYDYGQTYYEQGKMLGYGWNYVQLPADYGGKELKIVFSVTENNAFDGIPGISIANGAFMMQKSLAEGRVSLAISLFLMMFGLIGMIITFLMSLRNNAFVKTFCITTFSALIGCWTLCNGDLITFFTQDLKIKAFLEYTTFYLMMIPFTAYFYDRIKKETTPRFLKIYFRLLLSGEILFAVVVFILQGLNLVHFPAFVGAQHVIMGITVLFVLLLTIADYRRTHKVEKSLTFGFALAILVALYELVRYNLDKYLIGFNGNKYDSTLGIAALIIVITLFVDFGNRVTKSLYRAAQQEVLEQMAYMDELTGLANRRKCEEEMVALAADEHKKYAIVSLDMNLLKHINDTYGHESGDRALQDFAKVLVQAFPDSATVGRMGGDEFAAILPNTDRKTAEGYIDRMLYLMQEYNEKATGEVRLSTAYGCACGNEADTPHGVYSKADERMYECKRRMKLAKQL